VSANYHLVKIRIGGLDLIYHVIKDPITVSWVNNLYIADHRGHWGDLRGYQMTDHPSHKTVSFWINRPAEVAPIKVQPQDWFYWNYWDIRSGDMLMGLHTRKPLLRHLVAINDLERIRLGQCYVPREITTEICLYFGKPQDLRDNWEIKKELLWYLYEHDLVDAVPRLGFEIQYHGWPILGRLVSHDPEEVRQLISPMDTATSVTITPSLSI
jgi:hypothetical protein